MRIAPPPPRPRAGRAAARGPGDDDTLPQPGGESRGPAALDRRDRSRYDATMPGRTLAVGDIHGDLGHLEVLLGRLPELTPADTLVFLGDYVDRGEASRQVVELVMALPSTTPARVVCLRGNHEDAWLTVHARGWPEYVVQGGNGCWATLRSYAGGPTGDELPTPAELDALLAASFFPPAHLDWMRSLALWYEDEHAVYVHAGLPDQGGRFLHPREVVDPRPLLWHRSERFFRDYRGKRVVCGHTPTDRLPRHLSSHTPNDARDMWVREPVVAVDTQCGHGGYLTAVELPSLRVHESR